MTFTNDCSLEEHMLVLWGTTLNALLGNPFLSSSIQPQTFNEVSIVLNPSTLSGARLCAVKNKGDTSQLLAKENLRDNSMMGEESYSKPILYASSISRLRMFS